ncbi:IclR family transcriptional regulator [Bifidobacterium mongoliense]|uniref:IclR family transcriptional regulator n=1 Tax=Bifidobacterium mongoliense TaxID=518643 RepID=UPI0026486484|nr:IclR family transcriptional regulator [Bifidobacterium mongoliense]MDN6024836.1 IclR family transcriptional regulator [Bifidobacterium mongoliense]MDN6050971.1 IclR family transcriptional regulator [Bifidobacterium mongoliense]MDN6719381.1 IclR family transcriptional regulator [Bifidobacterium mongoliense]
MASPSRPARAITEPDDQSTAAGTSATPSRPDTEIHSGVGVLDKTIKILDALQSGPSTLGQLVAATGLARPTAHRLATALERHRFVLRDQHGRFVIGSRFAELAAAAGEDRLLTAAGPILQTLLDRTGESAQIYRRQGDQRVCIASVERTSGLRDSIPVGAILSMEAGSAAQILLAWEDSERMHMGLRHARFTATRLAEVHKRGWAESANEREDGVCSISAPIRNASQQVIAAISISGPTGRMGSTPGRRYAPLVMSAGRYLSEALIRASTSA